MYQHYWGFTSPPFSNRSSERTFYESPLHEEALARLLYCVEEHKALAVLHGPRGCGKSQVLQILANHVRRSQKFCAQADLAGVSENAFLRQLEIQLRLGGSEADASTTRWRRLVDFFQSTFDSGLFSVLVLDNLEDAEPRAITAIRRLVHLHNQSAAHVVVIAGLDHGQLSPAVSDLLERAEMCIEIGPLKRSETESYVRTRLKASGNRRGLFDADAIEQLQHLTGGVPREINRLCDLALLAGMSEHQTAINRDLIAGLSQEHANRPSAAGC